MERIQSLLDERWLQAAIDEPIDEALASLDIGERPASARQLIRHVASTIQQVLARRSVNSRLLTEAQARDEAAFLIASCSLGEAGEGFETAMLEITDGSVPGLEVLYQRLGEYLKAHLRQTYVTWVFSRHLNPADWDMQRAIAEVLLERIRHDFPEGTPVLRPEQFVDCIPELFSAVQQAESLPTSDRLPW
jgi:hypothetical protein